MPSVGVPQGPELVNTGATNMQELGVAQVYELIFLRNLKHSIALNNQLSKFPLKPELNFKSLHCIN